MTITQEQYNVLKQKKREIDIVIKLLNKKMQQVDELSGVTINDLNVSISSESGIRRTASMTIVAKDSSFDIKEGAKIWLDKYIQIIVRIKDIHTNKYVDMNMGIYTIGNPNKAYNATTNSISLQLYDLMATLNGMRDGNLGMGVEYVIKQGENVREAFIAICQECGINKYSIVDIEETVPNDIRIGETGTWYDLLYQLSTILPKYQLYFDIDGTLVFEAVPINSNETIIYSDDLLQEKIIGYNCTTDFEGIKNSIVVIGATHEVGEYFDDNPNIVDNLCELNIEGVTEYLDNLKYGFVIHSDRPSYILDVKVNDLANKPLVYESDIIPPLVKDVYYVIKYSEDIDAFCFLGEVEPRWIAEETDNLSAFSIDKLGKISLVLMGGDYDNISSVSLAKERAEWELYNYTRLKDTYVVTLVPIYTLDVNQVIELTLPNKQGEEITEKYIITNISTTIGVTGTQDITICRYYPFYNSEIVVNNNFLTFSGNDSFSLKTYNEDKNWDGTLYYSTNKTVWQEWDGTEIDSTDNKLYLRGSKNTIISNGNASDKFVLSGATQIRCDGDIETLLDWRKVSVGIHPTMGVSCFGNLFDGCTSLISQPDLPATTLSPYCYIRMFNGCTNLLHPSKLPATTLTNSCYYYMYARCKKLQEVAKFHAITLNSGCCQGMYLDCNTIEISLTQTDKYQYEWRIPNKGTIKTAPTSWSYLMTTGTGTNIGGQIAGTYHGTINANTTYYTNIQSL